MKKGHNYSREQIDIIRSFRDTTSASEKQAVNYLSRTKWNIQNAINAFFDDGTEPEIERIANTAVIEQLYQALSSPSNQNPGVRYMDEEKFWEFNQQYLHFEEDNVALGYVLIHIMGVETSGYIELKHFLKLFEYLSVGDPKELAAFKGRLEAEFLGDKFLYKQVRVV